MIEENPQPNIHPAEITCKKRPTHLWQPELLPPATGRMADERRPSDRLNCGNSAAGPRDRIVPGPPSVTGSELSWMNEAWRALILAGRLAWMDRKRGVEAAAVASPGRTSLGMHGDPGSRLNICASEEVFIMEMNHAASAAESAMDRCG